MRCFVEDLTATQTAKLLRINQNTSENWYDYIRHALMCECVATSKEHLNGEIEIDESYF